MAKLDRYDGKSMRRRPQEPAPSLIGRYKQAGGPHGNHRGRQPAAWIQAAHRTLRAKEPVGPSAPGQLISAAGVVFRNADSGRSRDSASPARRAQPRGRVKIVWGRILG